MSQMGHFQTWARGVAKSALPSRTDVAGRACQVRKVPHPDIDGCAGLSLVLTALLQPTQPTKDARHDPSSGNPA